MNSSSAALSLKLVKLGYAISWFWFFRPVEAPIALLAIFPLVLAWLLSDGNKLPSNKHNYWVAFVILLLLISVHFILGNLTLSSYGWQFLRVCFPFLLAALGARVISELSEISRVSFFRFSVTCGGMVLGLDTVLRIVAHPSLFFSALSGDSIAAYDFKSLTFLYIDANISSFLALYLFLSFLASSLTPSRKFIPKAKGSWNGVGVCGLLACILFSFSRQAWFGLSAGMVVFLLLYSLKNSRLIQRIGSSPVIFFITIFLTIIYVLVQASTFSESQVIESQNLGSVVSKVDLALYAMSFLENVTFPTVFFGLGPQNVMSEYVLSYSGHSLVGLIPEFGFFLIPLVFFWFRQQVGLLLFVPLLVGGVISLYPYAYILPLLLSHAAVWPRDAQ